MRSRRASKLPRPQAGPCTWKRGFQTEGCDRRSPRPACDDSTRARCARHRIHGALRFLSLFRGICESRIGRGTREHLPRKSEPRGKRGSLGLRQMEVGLGRLAVHQLGPALASAFIVIVGQRMESERAVALVGGSVHQGQRLRLERREPAYGRAHSGRER
jgi:hypothetical protein